MPAEDCVTVADNVPSRLMMLSGEVAGLNLTCAAEADTLVAKPTEATTAAKPTSLFNFIKVSPKVHFCNCNPIIFLTALPKHVQAQINPT